MEENFDQLQERRWWREEFTPRDSVSYDNRARLVTRPGGWDHEHCQVCRVVISQKSDTHWYGYRDEDDSWLCKACYARHVGHVHGNPPERTIGRAARRKRPRHWKRREPRQGR